MSETVEQINERVRVAQSNYDGILDTMETILIQERGFVSRDPIDEDIVALCSGGLDSSVMIDRVIFEYGAIVHPLFVKRGAKAEAFEEKAFDFFVDFYKRKYPQNIGEAANLDFKIPPLEFKDYFPKELGLSIGHPLRNSTLQNLAVMYAVCLNGKLGLNIRTVFTGSVAEGGTEPEGAILSLRSQTLNTCINLGDWGWQITSPLTDLFLRERPTYKVHLIKYALKENIPLEKTRTCFSDEEIADGTCDACKKRLRAFENAKVKDPLPYRGGLHGN
jgi:7-cyano-7-deazaguanine synthase in queuosine biosynthesis